jgi:hypothetical protein
VNEKKKKKSLLDILLPPVEDGASGNSSKKEVPEDVPAPAPQKKRTVPGQSIQADTAATIVLPSISNPEIDVFYKNIVERIKCISPDYDRFQKLLVQFTGMFPGAEDKAVTAAVIAMGENGANIVTASIDEKFSTLESLSKCFAEETQGSIAELAKQEQGLPQIDQDSAAIDQQIEELQKQTALQVESLQKRIEGLKQKKEIVARQVQEGKAKIASAQGSFQSAIDRVKKEFENIKSKISKQ